MNYVFAGKKAHNTLIYLIFHLEFIKKISFHEKNH